MTRFQAIETLRETVAFQRSVIKSGEAFTETVAAVETDALAALADLQEFVEAAEALYIAHGCRDGWGDLNPTARECSCGECSDYVAAYDKVKGGSRETRRTSE